MAPPRLAMHLVGLCLMVRLVSLFRMGPAEPAAPVVVGVRKFESKSHLSLRTGASHNVVFFAFHRVVNVVIAPNAMVGEWRNCFERAPGANVSWSQCLDGRSGWE